ncbi:hypothetical protein FHR83_001469 [Actinoplanes campanulatus]|uniref:DUF3558 domain-containing protein n=1 Tax=Actinoplanes campanulatus TaxID=113559 RepID=A0A7W5FD10_9ACTN|nr:hypothetical protein [Actinoplanes campanulatus]MBB3093820.1 hypothetical protein [Actinoplanes campanulatus]GGN05913.1 hypothetical protein GCM10010109_13420 [Actinoplanes campanulatus]GID35102.1 hypothetical protein Aca09nite_16080 [Actinoplanes campanulatus]
MRRRSGSVSQGLPLFIIVISLLPLFLICGGFLAWFLVLPSLQGGARWEAANQSCPVLDTAIAARLGVATRAEEPASGRDVPVPVSSCRYRTAGAADVTLDVAVEVTTPGALQDAHEKALDELDESAARLVPIGEQRKDQIFGEPDVSIERLDMVSVVDNAVIEVKYGYPEDQPLDAAAKSALRDPLQSVTDQAVANLG